jgi:hypothetical protein
VNRSHGWNIESPELQQKIWHMSSVRMNKLNAFLLHQLWNMPQTEKLESTIIKEGVSCL